MSDNISVDEYQRTIDGLDDENDMLMILILLQEKGDTVIASEKETLIFSWNRHVYQSEEILI